MKKLALALVCFASVAFFASCQKPVDNPEPSIALMTGENYVYDGMTIDLDAEYTIGFRVASNSQTLKDLATFRLDGKVFDMNDNELYTDDTIITISGKEYVYEEVLGYTMTAKELVGKVSITATVIDVDGKSNSTTVNMNINMPAQALEEEDIEWVKIGHNVQDLSAYGLQWKPTNYKEPFTHILPADGCKLFACSGYGDDFANIKTDLDLAAYFNNLAEMTLFPDAINTAEYNKVDCNPANKDYNDLLITKDAEGDLHAILIKHATVGSSSGGSTQIVITGQAK